jgi:exo-beta-1,3-glucanase (GH17 family)
VEVNTLIQLTNEGFVDIVGNEVLYRKELNEEVINYINKRNQALKMSQ